VADAQPQAEGARGVNQNGVHPLHDTRQFMADVEAFEAESKADRMDRDGLLQPRFKSARQLRADHPTLRPPVIHGLTREGETMNIISASKVGKSWLVNGLALSVASGRHWLHQFAVERGDVLIIDNELHPETSANRLPKVAEAMGLHPSEWMDHVFVENLRGRQTDIFRMGHFFNALEPGRFKVIIIDAFYRVMPRDSDENDNGTITGVYNALDTYAARLCCTFVPIHHSSKGLQSDKAITDVGAGAGAQSRAADCHLVLRHHETEGAIVLDAAVRSWPPVQPLCLRWDFPLWVPAPELDPADLKRASGRRRKEADEQPKEAPPEPWTLERFVVAFIPNEPADKKIITTEAKVAGISLRMIDSFIASGLAKGSIHRWNLAKDRRVMLANRPEPTLSTTPDIESETRVEDISHARATPHTPRVGVNATRGEVSAAVCVNETDHHEGIPV